MLLTDKLYNKMKWIAQFVLPATGTLYFALASIWGLPYGEQVIGTLTAIDIFLGVILGISTQTYRKTAASATDGQLLIDTNDPTKDIYRLELGDNLTKLGEKRIVTLEVKPNQTLTD